MTVSEIANVSGQPAIRLEFAKLTLIYAAQSMTCAVLKEPQMNAKELDIIRAEAGMANVEMQILVPFLIRAAILQAETTATTAWDCSICSLLRS